MSEIHDRDPDVLAAWLRAWACEYDSRFRPAVELLIGHGSLPGRIGFIRVRMRRHGCEARIDWAARAPVRRSRARRVVSKLARPDPAVALGEIRYRLSTIGEANVGPIAAAVAPAVGVDR